MASRRSSTSSKSGMYSPRSDDLDDIQQPTDTPNFPEPNISQSPQPHRLSTLSILSQEATRRSRPQARHSTGTPTVEDLFKLFANTKSESREMRRSLRNAQIKLEQSRARAAKAERLALDMAQRVRDASDERVSALREGATVREELGQYKARYESALKEISRARELLKDTDNLRYDAEVQAARARDIARKMRTDILVSRAKEEGRRMGYEEGAFAGQNVGYRVGRRNDPDRREVTDAMADLLEDEDAFRGYIGRYSPPPVQQMNIPRTPEQASEPPTPLQRTEPVFNTTPPQQFPVSQPSTVGRYINDDPFVTPTPAPRPPSTSASTTTLPAAPPTNLAFQPMPTISERSSVPDVVNTEPPVSRHSSVRRDRVVSPPATTPRSPVLPLPSNPNMHVNVYVPMPPPGQVYEESPGVPPIGGEDYLPPPPTGQMPGYPGGEPGYYPSVPGSSQ
ncbi:hypothetical protein OF83DRAFT_86169 [Amylostereum chailletii]|nr:hypothetical protein OF83DRAFT_86169 [Amylostereum chailletii]